MIIKAHRCGLHGPKRKKCPSCEAAESSNKDVIEHLQEELAIANLEKEDLRVALIDIQNIIRDNGELIEVKLHKSEVDKLK